MKIGVGGPLIDTLRPIFEKALWRFPFSNKPDFGFHGQITAELEKSCRKSLLRTKRTKSGKMRAPRPKFLTNRELLTKICEKKYFRGRGPPVSDFGTLLQK